MEKLYRDSLKREEERLACQRQMLAVYQKELRNRKAEVAVQVQESEQRQRALKMEKDLELLMQSIECEVSGELIFYKKQKLCNYNVFLYFCISCVFSARVMTPIY